MRPCSARTCAERRVDGRRVGHVHDHHAGHAPGPAPAAGPAASARADDVGGHDQRAPRREGEADGPADAPPGPGHDRNFPGQVKHVRTNATKAATALEVRRRPRCSRTSRPSTIFRPRPVNTVPGPTSTYLRTPSDASRRITSSHRTGADTWRTSASMLSAAVRFGSASTLATTGTRGRRRRSARSSGARRVLGGLHQRAMERRAHRQRDRAFRAAAPSPARSRAPRRLSSRRSPPGPARSCWPGSPRRPAPPRRTPRRPWRRRDRGWRPSRPARPARPPACSGRGGAPSATRRRNAMVPAATCAEYSPRLWPATNAGLMPSAPSRPEQRDADRQDRRLRVLGEDQPLRRPVEAQAAQASPSASSASAIVSRTIGKASASALPIPTFCDPCPGK